MVCCLHWKEARIDGDNDLNFQIETFLEEQKRDEEEFLGHFDPSDNQAVCQAIQLQVGRLTNIVSTNSIYFSSLVSS